MKQHIPDLLAQTWAITPSKFATMLEVYDRHASGEKFDVEGLRAAGGEWGADGNQPAYTVESGVAIVPISGVLSKRMNMLSYFSGGTSTQVLADTISTVAADPTVKGIILSIDSPGGEVDGTQVCAQAVAAATKAKPVLAWMDGMCCSAAYWIASQADGQYIADLTTWVGSIGTIAAHRDQSRANDQRGIKVTEITAGKYKRIASQNEPLSQDGRDDIQSKLDQIYSVFVRDVANGLGVSTDTVLSNMADGRTFIGQRAIDAGLAQGVASLDQLVAKLNGSAAIPSQTPRASLPGGTTTIQATTGGVPMPTPVPAPQLTADEQNAAAHRKGIAAGALIRERVSAAAAEGRKIGVLTAAAELRREGKI